MPGVGVEVCVGGRRCSQWGGGSVGRGLTVLSGGGGGGWGGGGEWGGFQITNFTNFANFFTNFVYVTPEQRLNIEHLKAIIEKTKQD